MIPLPPATSKYRFFTLSTYTEKDELATIFKLAPDGTLTVLHAFKTETGFDPIAPLMAGKDGYIYGTTSAGGMACNDQNHNYSCGTIFRLEK